MVRRKQLHAHYADNECRDGENNTEEKTIEDGVLFTDMDGTSAVFKRRGMSDGNVEGRR